MEGMAAVRLPKDALVQAVGLSGAVGRKRILWLISLEQMMVHCYMSWSAPGLRASAAYAAILKDAKFGF